MRETPGKVFLRDFTDSRSIRLCSFQSNPELHRVGRRYIAIWMHYVVLFLCTDSRE